MSTPVRGGYVVLQQTGEHEWRLVGEADRRPGLPARRSRAQAVRDVLGREPAAARSSRSSRAASGASGSTTERALGPAVHVGGPAVERRARDVLEARELRCSDAK